jgi:uncharacterized membrane protein
MHMLSNADIRYAARERLKGNWGMAVLVVFLYSIIIGAVSSVPILGYIAYFILMGPFVFGLAVYFLQLTRGQRPELSVMFSGFQQFGVTLVLFLLVSIFTFLWSLLLIVPGIIAALRYSMAFFILSDNPGMSAMEAIRQSAEMTKGHKGKLFMLFLSFIGWYLLTILTLGIGLLWLAPYVQTSMAAFYEQLKTPQYLPQDTITV